MALNAWQRKLENLAIVMEDNGLEIPKPDVEPDPAFDFRGDILDALSEAFDPLEHDLGVHVNFKRQKLKNIWELTVDKHTHARADTSQGKAALNHVFVFCRLLSFRKNSRCSNLRAETFPSEVKQACLLFALLSRRGTIALTPLLLPPCSRHQAAQSRVSPSRSSPRATAASSRDPEKLRFRCWAGVPFV